MTSGPSTCGMRSSTTRSSSTTCARAGRSSSTRRARFLSGRPRCFRRTAWRRQSGNEAAARELVSLDATCPLVSRVHAAVLRYAGRGYTILFVGHAGHPEVEGVMGEAPEPGQADPDARGRRRACRSTDERRWHTRRRPLSAWTTSPASWSGCASASRAWSVPRRATCATRRRTARRPCARWSSSTRRRRAGARLAELVELESAARGGRDGRRARVSAGDGAPSSIRPGWRRASGSGFTAGASTPEHLVQALVERLRELGATEVETVETRVEDVFFAPPPMRRYRTLSRPNPLVLPAEPRQ